MPTADGSDTTPATKVIYVMGAGRSGSTILGVTLGNSAGVFYAGELDKWLPRAGVSPLQGAERARFWDAVREQVDSAELFGTSTRYLERSSALLRPRAWRERRRLRGRYRAVAQRLFDAIARVAGAQTVIDTSHYPLRARELQRLSGTELHLLFLVRDPQAVVASFGRADVPERTFGVLTANAYLWLTHALCVWVFLRQPRERRMLVRHEDFLADPRGVVEAILGQAGAGAAPADLSSLQTGPVFQANRLVRSSVVALHAEQPHARHASLLTALLQAPSRALLALLSPAAHAHTTAAPASGERSGDERSGGEPRSGPPGGDGPGGEPAAGEPEQSHAAPGASQPNPQAPNRARAR